MIEARDRRRRTERRRAQWKLHGHDVVGVEADRNAAELHEGGGQQNRAGQEDHGQRDLRDDHCVRETVPRHVDAGSGCRFQGVARTCFQQSNRAEQSEGESDDH